MNQNAVTREEPQPTFSIGDSVGYRGKLWSIKGAEIMGVTGWRYTLENSSSQITGVWPHEMQAVKRCQ